MKLQNIIIWILILISLGFALWYLFGNTPTIEEALIVMILSLMFTLIFKINNLERKVSIQMTKFNHLVESFKSLASDFKEKTKK